MVAITPDCRAALLLAIYYRYRVENFGKIKRVEDELFLLFFSTRSLTNL